MSIRPRHGILTATVVGVVLALFPPEADAHLVQTGFGTFYDGITHLFITPSDLLVTIGLGLLAGLRGLPASRWMVFIAPAAWLVGGVFGSVYPIVGTLPWLTTLSFGTVGILVATAPRIPLAGIVSLGIGAGSLHGLVNGATMTPGGSNLLSLVGASLAVFTAITFVTAIAASVHAKWTHIAMRAAGSWIAAVGLLMLGWLFRAR